MRKKRLGRQNTKRIVRIVLVVCVFLVLISLIRIIRTSIFFQKRDHINIISYGAQTSFFSFGLVDNTNYGVSFLPDTKVDVPGGYGVYRIGALGKLVSLEKKPDILLKTFSTATGSLVDFYIMPDSAEIYYGAGEVKPMLPNIQTILFGNSNMNMFERVYLSWLILRRGGNAINSIAYTDAFASDYQGYFFDTVYRNERLNVQILYKDSYETALALSKPIEGEGIRVGDITAKQDIVKQCIIEENREEFSNTARALAAFFSCKLKTGKTGGYDILFWLGERERDWYFLS